MKYFALLLALFAVVAITFAQECVDEAEFELEFCGSKQSGKFCGGKAVVDAVCSEISYNSWKEQCPKKKDQYTKDKFCEECVPKKCTDDKSCEAVPVEPVEPKKLCYKACQECYEDAKCDEFVEAGVVAPKGEKDCTSSALAMGVSFVLIALAVVFQF